MSNKEDENLQEWLASYFPALMTNKPYSLIAHLRDFSEDKKIDWFMRCNVLDAVIAKAHDKSETDLEHALDWAKHIAADESEDWTMRTITGATLLDFPRERYKPLLNTLAEQQTGWDTNFDKKDVDLAYSRNKDQPGWERFENPWHFYDTNEINKRQQRWYKEDQPEIEDLDLDEEPFNFNAFETYQRDTPKTGRNDPCPCGSGKKHKKCCLNKQLH